jgi:hypothetical protein
VSGLMEFRDDSDRGIGSNFLANLGKRATETLTMIRQEFREEGVEGRGVERCSDCTPLSVNVFVTLATR